jgi:BCCT family betaine/carnitine transporter
LGGRLIDLIFVIATVGAAGGTIGSYIPMLSSGFSDIFSVDKGFSLDLKVLALCVGLFGFSVYSGLTKGIKRLSDLNLLLAIAFLIIILFIGPGLDILRSSLDGLVYTVKYFWDMSTLGILEQSDFADAWTIFYWAWWVAFGPLVALFIARISKGRTLRELILGMLIFGSLGTWLFYMILGGYSMSLEQNGVFGVMDSLKESGHADTAISIVHTMPFDNLMLLLFCVITIIFVTTSYDSMSFVIAYHVQKNSSEQKDPDKELRLFWAVVLGVLPAALVIYSDHTVAMDLILITSLPLLFIYPLMALAIFKDLN